MKSEDILRKTQELLSAKSEAKKAEKMQVERERSQLVDSLSKNIADLIRPALEEMAQAQQVTVDSIRQMLKEIKVEVPRTEVQMPQINVPRPQVSVNVPEFKMPPLNIPAPVVNFPEKMSVSMDSVDNKSPLPVMMMGSDGKPMSFSMGAGGGGKADFFNIKDIKTSTGASWFNDEGLRVSGSFSVTASNSSTQAIDSSGEAYSQANPFPVIDMSGALGTTSVVGDIANGSLDFDSPPVKIGGVYRSTAPTYTDGQRGDVRISNKGAMTVNLVDGAGTGLTNSNTSDALSASSNSVTSGAVNYAYNGTSWDRLRNTAGEGNALRVQQANDAVASVNVVSSSAIVVSSITASTATSLIDSTGVQYSGSNPVPVTGTVLVSDITASLKSSIIDSSGVQYSGSNPVPVTMVTSAVVSTVAVGPVASDVADDGSAPLKQGGIARQANPTAVSAGDTVSFTADDLGRQLTRPVQVRDLLQTAYVSLTTGTETTLLSGSAGFYYDLVYIMGANNSDAVAVVDIRPVTGGNIVMTLVVPPYGTAGVSLPVPLPQTGSDGTGNNWTADMNDITGTTVYVSALFSKEV